MSSMYTGTSLRDEIRRSFYPDPDNGSGTSTGNVKPSISQKTDSDALYFSHRYPFLLQRLYQAADAFLDTYAPNDFIYDRCPDYVSLHHMRDRLLENNRSVTELFLQGGCTLTWLNLLTDCVISELLTKRRRDYRNPMGEASTTSVRSELRS